MLHIYKVINNNKVLASNAITLDSAFIECESYLRNNNDLKECIIYGDKTKSDLFRVTLGRLNIQIQSL